MSKKPAKAKMTPMEKELARVNYESMQRYQQKYMPMEAGFVKDIMNSKNQSVQNAQNEAAGSSQMAFERNQPQQEMGLAGAGATINSGRGIFGRQGANEDLATSRASNTVAAGGAARDAYYRNLGALVAQGKGKEIDALRTGTQAASMASKQAIIDAQASQGARMARNQLIGTAAGYGLGAGIDSLNPKAAQVPAGGTQQYGMTTYAQPGWDSPVGSPRPLNPDGSYQ